MQQWGDSSRKQQTYRTAALLGSLSSYLFLKFPLSTNYLYKTKGFAWSNTFQRVTKSCHCCFPGKARSRSALRAPIKESPYTEMSVSSSKNLELLDNISTDFFVGNEVSENNVLPMKTLIQDIWKTEQLNNSVFTIVWTCMFSSAITKMMSLNMPPFTSTLIHY